MNNTGFMTLTQKKKVTRLVEQCTYVFQLTLTQI